MLEVRRLAPQSVREQALERRRAQAFVQGLGLRLQLGRWLPAEALLRLELAFALRLARRPEWRAAGVFRAGVAGRGLQLRGQSTRTRPEWRAGWARLGQVGNDR